ncbi:MAG: glycosyltransferase family 4 protein, partial [Pseudobdellovibrionaceae bacterium]
MKILYLCTEVNLKSGWAVVAYHTIAQALKSKHEVTVLTQLSAQNIILDGATYHPWLFDFNTKKTFVSYANLCRIILLTSRIKFDIVHILVEPYLAYSPLFLNKKTFLTIHGTYGITFFKSSKWKFLYRLFLLPISRVFSNSEYTRDRFFNQTKFQPINIADLGVDTKQFKIKNNIQDRKLVFSFVGQVKHRKGLLTAIKAIQTLYQKYADVKLYIVGDCTNSYAQACIKYVNDSFLNNVIFFLGKVSDQDLADIYNKSICNILPSINTNDGSFEGYGLIHLEANAMGIPTIGSLNTGNESAIIDGVTGYLAEQEN